MEQDANQWYPPLRTTPTPLLDARPDQQVEREELQVAWTFSTGVLRGHEGGPLVIGDTMYVHTPFPNIVYALDLNADGAHQMEVRAGQDPNVIPVMCCDTVNRGVAYAPAGDGYGRPHHLHQADRARRVECRHRRRGVEVKSGDPSRAETGTNAPMVVAR